MNGVVDYRGLYHTGIVVRDFERAQDEFAQAYGLTWGLNGESEVPVLFTDLGLRMVTFRFCYSNEGPHRVELVRAVEGTMWEPAGNGQAHHLGFWCDDVATTAKGLDAMGWATAAVVGYVEGEPPAITMHRSPNGHFIELVSSDRRPFMFPDD
ncbi:MAG: VOC family protein [Acidimicrobiia bacterium]